MKKLLYIILGIFLILPMATSAFAGGPPPKDVMKGTFLSVDDTARTAVFKKSGSEETSLLVLGADMSPGDVRVNKKVMVSLDKHAGTSCLWT
jgi:predicted ABC-type transport system involved in lysophospholipase L1 biosynthesis ATPase subunit